MLRRISWSALAALALLVLALLAAIAGEDTTAIVLALGSITWAVLSTKEGT